MRLLMIGSGYVGLVSGTCLAQMGHHVTCLDINEEKIARLQKGDIPIYEPGLSEMLKRNVKEGRLTFTTDYASAVKDCLICFIAVDTPSDTTGAASIAQVKNVAKSIAEHMPDYRTIVNKSTVPVGTANIVSCCIQETLQKRNLDFDFDVVSNPEFLKEGDAIADFMKPDRVVIGSNSDRASAIMREIYAPFMLSRERLFLTDVASAEMIKYACNAMLATRISFMNELSGLCEAMGADITKVRKGMGYDPRIGPNFLYAGLGFGGSCLPKDLRALIALGKEQEHRLSLTETVYQVNERQKKQLTKKMHDYYLDNGGIAGKTFAVLGVSFKPNTDDIRESPAVAIIEQLQKKGAFIRIFDPVAMDNACKQIPSKNIVWCTDEMQCCTDADAVILATEWHQFRHLDLAVLVAKMRHAVFFDGRNQYEPSKMLQQGIDYISIGRRPVFGYSSGTGKITQLMDALRT